ncbi:aspartic peptidase domain-containing protein [Mycena filopes]|nr:aspartic peptidase domain-containing protein [Mycena filopes]
MWSGAEKGKGRAMPSSTLKRPRNLLPRDAEGSGGPDGIVLPLQYVSEGPYDIIFAPLAWSCPQLGPSTSKMLCGLYSYTLPLLLGSDSSNLQNLSLQIDTGSSDLWIASSSCSSSVCGSTSRYDPSDATYTNYNFTINYLVGDVAGPIVWDTVTVGGYGVSNQAFAAANVVDSEPLESQFSGVLGLALPSNSLIAEQITPIVGDTPDGAVWMSNLFSITPASSAPAARFLSIALARPGSPTVPSVLGIGRHPRRTLAYDILYAPSSDGPRFWKAAVRGITVYTNNTRMPIVLGRGVSGVFPSAVLDTGVPLILTTKAVADAIYGAIGITPASDNMYYMPCTMPLNMTVTLDDREEIPLHPLDLSTTPQAGASDPNSCIGLIQTSAEATLENPTSGIGDMVFGVPFLRNVYTVLAYDIPNADGTFPIDGGDSETTTTTTNPLGVPVTPISSVPPSSSAHFSSASGGSSSSHKPSSSGKASSSSAKKAARTALAPRAEATKSFSGSAHDLSLDDDPTIHPRLGLMALTDPTIAMDEFHRVRVLNQPLGDANGGSASGSSGAHKQNVGIDVLIGLASFVGLCILLFGLRWLMVRRSLRRETDERRGLSARDVKSGRDLALALGGYQLARRGPQADEDGRLPTEDELRQRRYDAYMHSLHTVSTDRTQIEPSGDEGYVLKDGAFYKDQTIDPDVLPVSPRDNSPFLREPTSESPERARHRSGLSVNRPLLPDLAGGGHGGGEDEPMSLSMAGVGTARHSPSRYSRRRSLSGNDPSPHRPSGSFSHNPDDS